MNSPNRVNESIQEGSFYHVTLSVFIDNVCFSSETGSLRELSDNMQYERPGPHARQSVHKYISHINSGFSPEEQKRDRKSFTQSVENGRNIESDYLEPIDPYDDTAESTQHVYEYIDERLEKLGTFDFGRYVNRQEIERDSRRKLCGALKKYKIIVVATIVNLLLVTVILGVVIGLILPTRSDKEATSEDEAYQTTEGTLSEHTTSHDGINYTGKGLLVIIGGRNTASFYDTVQIYTVDDGHVTWNKYGTPAPFKWFRGGTATTAGNIYIAGGSAWDSNGTLGFRRVAKYNVKGDIWEVLPNKIVDTQQGPAIYVINNQLYAADGDNEATFPFPSTQTERLNLSNVQSGWMTEQASPYYDVWDAHAAVIGNTVYICAGTPEPTKTVMSWTHGEPAWTPVADMNVARGSYHEAVTDGISNIWVVGGCDPDYCWPDGFIEHYNVTDNTWTKLTQVPDIEKGRYNVEVCSFWQGYIFVIFSGHGSSERITRFHVYNTHTGKWHEESTEFMLPVRHSMSAIVPETF